MLQQHLENSKGLFLKSDSPVVFVQFTGPEVEPEGPETNSVGKLLGLHRDKKPRRGETLAFR
jgi:hypothetical protein